MLQLAPDDALRLNPELAALLRHYAVPDRSGEEHANRAVVFASVPLEADC